MEHPIRAALSAREVAGGLELHDPSSGSTHRLDAVASAVWQLCDGAHDIPAIAATIARQFGASADQVTTDIERLLTQFGDVGLIQSGGRAQQAEQLLLRCVRRALPDASAATRFEPGDAVDWNALVRLSLWHGVLPLVRRHVAGCTPETIPDLVRERIESHGVAIAGANQRLLLELLELLEIFARAGLPTVSLKGPLLAATVYGDVSARQLTDLDIFVPPERSAEAADLLRARGHLVRSQQATGFDTYRESDGLSIDVQWALGQREWCLPVDLAELWPRLEQTAIEGRIVQQPRPDDYLRFLCAHGATHCWCALKWIADVAMLVERFKGRIDWPSLLTTARRRGGLRQLLLGLRLSHDVLGASIPAAAATAIHRDPAVIPLAREIQSRLFAVTAAPTHQGSYGYFAGGWLYMRTRERARDRVPFLLSVPRRVITPTARDRAVVALPRSLGWGYYLVRPFRLATRLAERRWRA
jgi:hypothetical protein